jgi:2-C-methyl-D-erythritol 4-phosphate cytidylyltransferase
MDPSDSPPLARLDPSTPVHAVVPAAGLGLRFGGANPKQFAFVSGKPVLHWTVERLLAGGVATVTVVLPAEIAERPPEWLRTDPRIFVVAGGANRQASVALGVGASPAEPEEWIAVHDGARPALAPEDLVAVCVAAQSGDGAVLGRPLADTLKRLEQGGIVETIDRRSLFRAETPQVFRRELLERAIAAATETRFAGTDESSLVERLAGVRVIAVEAQAPNPKLTTPADLSFVAALLALPSAAVGAS